jgi:hypothetical protein
MKLNRTLLYTDYVNVLELNKNGIKKRTECIVTLWSEAGTADPGEEGLATQDGKQVSETANT